MSETNGRRTAHLYFPPPPRPHRHVYQYAYQYGETALLSSAEAKILLGANGTGLCGDITQIISYYGGRINGTDGNHPGVLTINPSVILVANTRALYPRELFSGPNGDR